MNPAFVVVPMVLGVMTLLVWRWLYHDFRPIFPKKPRQDEAVDLVWHGFYMAPRRRWYTPWRRRPPAVEWIEGDRLQLRSGDGLRGGWWTSYDPDGIGPLSEVRYAVSGLAHAEPGRDGYVQCAWVPAMTSFADGSLTHELMHPYLSWYGGHPDGDPGHIDARWKFSDGAARQRLRDAGF